MDVQLAEPPQVASPEAGKEVSWSQLFEMRLVDGSFQGAGEGLQSACSWFRILEDSRPRTVDARRRPGLRLRQRPGLAGGRFARSPVLAGARPGGP